MDLWWNLDDDRSLFALSTEISLSAGNLPYIIVTLAKYLSLKISRRVNIDY